MVRADVSAESAMHKSVLSVREASLEDAGPLARLSEELGYPCGLDQIIGRLEQILKRTDHALLVAEMSDTPPGGSAVVGWVHAYIENTIESDPTVEIGGLVVAQHHRGVGIGRLLMEEAERWARASDCASITVRSNVVRERAHAFYEGLGYSLVKTQRVFRKLAGG